MDNNIKKWCSNKDNIKILFMIGMAIILIFVLIHRFGGNGTQTSDASMAPHKTGIDSQAQASVPKYIQTMPYKKRSEKMVSYGQKPPPFLKRDLFFSRKIRNNPIRNGEREELNLELTATIIDSQGAVAIIGNEVLGMGEIVEGLRVTSIKNNEVILSKGKAQYVLRIKEE
jgi:hypothetical protein